MIDCMYASLDDMFKKMGLLLELGFTLHLRLRKIKKCGILWRRALPTVFSGEC